MSDADIGFSFRPEFEGELTADATIEDDFFARFGRRVESGLFSPGNRSKANYRVTSSTGDTLTFEAADFRTATSVGLNHVELRRNARDTIAYRVRFGRWNGYVVVHAMGIASLLSLAYFVVPSVSRQVNGRPLGPPIFWAMVLFWGLCWPWILTAVHRGAARDALESVLLEELEGESNEDVA